MSMILGDAPKASQDLLASTSKGCIAPLASRYYNLKHSAVVFGRFKAALIFRGMHRPRDTSQRLLLEIWEGRSKQSISHSEVPFRIVGFE